MNFGEKRAAIEFFRGLPLEIEVGVVGGPNEELSMVDDGEIGVIGVNSEEYDSCRSFLSRE